MEENIAFAGWNIVDEHDICSICSIYSEVNTFDEFWNALSDEETFYYHALMFGIVEDEIKIKGSDYAIMSHLPFFTDGTYAFFSVNTWCDLMSFVWSYVEGKEITSEDFYGRF